MLLCAGTAASSAPHQPRRLLCGSSKDAPSSRTARCSAPAATSAAPYRVHKQERCRLSFTCVCPMLDVRQAQSNAFLEARCAATMPHRMRREVCCFDCAAPWRGYDCSNRVSNLSLADKARQGEQATTLTVTCINQCICVGTIAQGACQADCQLVDCMAAVQQAAEVQQVAERLLCDQVKPQSAQQHLHAPNLASEQAHAETLDKEILAENL